MTIKPESHSLLDEVVALINKNPQLKKISSTTAPDSVGQCVIANLDGVILQPGDKRRGEATWNWDFSAAQEAR